MMGKKICILTSVHSAFDTRIFYKQARTLAKAGYGVILIAQHGRNEIDDAIRSVIENTQFILGPEVGTFESEIAAYCRTEFAIGVAWGTDALQLAFLACDIKPGDEVITTPFTFIATAIYYPLSLHLQQAYKRLSYKPSDFPESKKDREEVLSLLIYPELGDDKIEEIFKAIESHDK